MATSVGSRRDNLRLGVQRASLNNNPLLVKPQLGKPIRRCFTLPSSDFTYGMPTVCVDGGAAQALSSWLVRSSRSVSQKNPPEKDFLALNKLAAQSGLTTSREQTQFRATHSIHKKERERERLGSRVKLPEDITYGISTRPSTPIFDLLQNRYQDKWLRETKDIESREREKMIQKKLYGKVYETRATLLRHYQEPLDPPAPWRMRRFSKIPANLKTFRTEKERTTAFEHHASDSTARAGVFGHGIYQTA